ncbi:unnamed protein product [Caenorhabditis auriculariae]|uniref:Uncharacterized protein n=1 Tax=Caenorhabditis auriculariae TaxID=2777116 RepID=A0A8S1GQ93_9PELO|nr:unnamed protein product [Caenorhabditis auriculariae]
MWIKVGQVAVPWNTLACSSVCSSTHVPHGLASSPAASDGLRLLFYDRWSSTQYKNKDDSRVDNGNNTKTTDPNEASKADEAGG